MNGYFLFGHKVPRWPFKHIIPHLIHNNEYKCTNCNYKCALIVSVQSLFYYS